MEFRSRQATPPCEARRDAPGNSTGCEPMAGALLLSQLVPQCTSANDSAALPAPRGVRPGINTARMALAVNMPVGPKMGSGPNTYDSHPSCSSFMGEFQKR